jgi:hypothetical protein
MLFQMRRVQILSFRPYRRILNFLPFVINFLRFLRTNTRILNICNSSKNEQTHSNLAISNSILVIVTSYIFLHSIQRTQLKFHKHRTTFEISYFQTSLLKLYVLYPGKFVDMFDIVQLLENKFFKIFQIFNALRHIPLFIIKFMRSQKFVSWSLQNLLCQ